jgi:peptidoglycan/xylan/chitin deacetylase (PgdA/CDA1 family)
MWHGFEEQDAAADPYCVFVPPLTFARQLDLLVERRAHFLDLDGYLAGLSTGRWPARSVLVTIDDGYVSTLTEAAPMLAARSIPAVMFALPGRLGGHSAWMPGAAGNPLLDADGLRELERHGVRVEAHGWDHTTLPGLPAAELHRQVAETREALADLLGRAPVAFAYPSGEHDAAARAAVRSAGYSCAFAVHEPHDNDRWALSRVDVNPTETEFSFRLKASRWWPAAYRTLGRVAPVRRGIHRMLGSGRSADGAAEQPTAP